jgi:hypothetical protein
VRHDGAGHRIYTDGMGPFRVPFERLSRAGKHHSIRSKL